MVDSAGHVLRKNQDVPNEMGAGERIVFRVATSALG